MSTQKCSHGAGCTPPWAVHDWSFEVEVEPHKYVEFAEPQDGPATPPGGAARRGATSPCEVDGCPNEGTAWQYGLLVCPQHTDEDAR